MLNLYLNRSQNDAQNKTSYTAPPTKFEKNSKRLKIDAFFILHLKGTLIKPTTLCYNYDYIICCGEVFVEICSKMARTLVQAPGLFKLLKFVLALSFNFGDGKEGVNNFPIKPSTTRGLLIDAGSGGSRLHIYQWAPRIFKSIPGEISYPTTNERMTGKITPGVANIVTFEGIRNHLEPLIDFARVTLVGLESEFAGFPIHFKATGGMRELPLKQRELIMENVRILLSDKSFCPFYFVHEMARVISGEEEAVYS